MVRILLLLGVSTVLEPSSDLGFEGFGSELGQVVEGFHLASSPEAAS